MPVATLCVFTLLGANSVGRLTFFSGYFTLLSVSLWGLLIMLVSGTGNVFAQSLNACDVIVHNAKGGNTINMALNTSVSVPLKKFENKVMLVCKLDDSSVLEIANGSLNHSQMLIDEQTIVATPANQLVFSLPKGQFQAELNLGADQNKKIVFSLYRWSDYALKGQQHNFLLGVFFGLCITLITYLYFMGRSLKDKRFHYYCYYVCGIGLFFLLQEGNLHLFYDASTISHAKIKLLIGGLTVFFGSVFIVNLLDLKNRWPRMTNITILYPAQSVLALTVLLLFIAKGMWFSVVVSIVIAIVVLIGVFTIVLVSYALYHRVHTAGIILLATLIAFGALTLRIIVDDGDPFWQRYGLLFAFAIESFLFAIATSERIKRINDDRMLAEAQAMTDPLCNVLNRRGWESAAQKMLKAHEYRAGVLCLLYIDLDHFKKINDTYGHKTGDEVLCIVSKIIRKQMRDQDAVGRLGGDEFVGLAHFDDDLLPRALRDRMAQRLTDIHVKTEKGVIKVSASVGCVFANGDVTQVGDLLHKADEAMYLTKKEKRQKVSCQA